MSLSNTTVKALYVGNGVNKTFSIPFSPIVDDSAETKVYLRDETVPSAITTTLLTEGALNDYTLTGAPDANSFHVNVELTASYSAPTASQYILVIRELPLTQTMDMSVSGFRPPTVEEMGDRLAAMIQQLNEKLTRVPILGISERETEVSLILPEPIDGRLLAWKSDGTGWEFVTQVEAIDQLTGDVTAGPGTGSQVATLATVNSNVGSFTNASVTVNAKGLVTAASSGTAAVTSIGVVSPISSTGGTTPTISLDDTTVTPGSYTYVGIVVDAKGRITSAASGATPVTSVGATSPIASSGGTTPTISIPTASGAQSGALSSTDWTTFNNKQAGPLTGDVTTSGAAATIANNAVTDAKLRQSAGMSVIARATNSTGDVADVTAANDDEVLRRSGTSIAFGGVNLAGSNATTGILPIAKGGTNNSSALTEGSVLFSDGTKITDDNTGIYYNRFIKALGVGSGTSLSGTVQADALTGPTAPSGGTGTVNAALSGYVVGDGPHSYNLYSSAGGYFSATPHTISVPGDFEIGETSSSITESYNAYTHTQTVEYRTYTLWDTDTKKGDYSASGSLTFTSTGTDNGSAVTNVGGPGGYNTGDTVNMRVYALYEGDTTWHPVSFVEITGITEGTDTFDISWSIAYDGLGTPSNFVWEREVNGGGYVDYIVAGASWTDTNAGFTVGTPSYTNVTWGADLTITAPVNSPSNYVIFRNISGAGYNEHKFSASTSITDDGTGWLAGTEAAIMGAYPAKEYGIDVSWTNAAGITTVRVLKSDDTPRFNDYYRDVTGSTLQDIDTSWTSGSTVTPSSGYVFYGSGGASLLESTAGLVGLKISKDNTSDAPSGEAAYHLLLENSNGTPRTRIGFKHGSSVEGLFFTDQVGNLGFASSSGNTSFYSSLSALTNPVAVFNGTGIMATGSASTTPAARLHSRGGIPLRIDNSSGSQMAGVDSSFNPFFGGSSSTTSNSLVGRVMTLETDQSTNSVLHLKTNTNITSRGGILEVSGGKTGADARIGQIHIRYINSTASDSTGALLFQVNNDSASLVDAFYSVGNATLNALTRFGSSTTPTAVVHVRAGSTAAASFCMDVQTAPTSPVSGDMWHDSTRLAYQNQVAGVKQTIPGVLFTQTASATVANTVSETTLTSTGIGTLTLPANFFAIGKTIRLKARGLHSSTGNPTLTLKLKLGSTVLASTGAVASNNGTADGWEVEVDLTCRTTGASATSKAHGTYHELHSSGKSVAIKDQGATFASTSSQAVTLTAQWGTASASNTITCDILTLEVLN